MLYKCWLAAQRYVGPNTRIRTDKSDHVWQESGAESDECSAAT